MIGRNDPCLCGSGKKYKKCCEKKNEVSVEQLVNGELERVIAGVYEQSPDPKDVAEFDNFKRQWTSRLTNHLEGHSIEESVTEYFLFVARQDMWRNHLAKVQSGPVRSALQSVLETWQQPTVLFGRMNKEKNDFVEINELLGNNTYYLEKEDGMPADKGSLVFGVVLPDERKHANGVYIITSLLFLRDLNGSIGDAIVKLADAGNFEDMNDFYKEHMLDIYEILMAKDNVTLDELIEHDLTPVHRESLVLLDDVLKEKGFDDEARLLLKNMCASYILKERPNFRKPGVMSAAIFLIAIDLGILGETDLSNKEVAELFDVSTSSMTKHAESINEFIHKMYDKMVEDKKVNA
ncbi:SEC-C metal-binding domain-containing protein [Filibacter tadaridae]|uniref:SEC-C motif protein n=1 Tax=Filibacter tadaridae TaxID=2483811 RepID=A0A3P5WWQ4_9BACL|nr:SEC-C metal-binding domain-containing protein [Filibacter tadaridae]VDC19313.1 hypothetical protein FILTAD_00249 [Filibacter tadaridae]